MKRIGWLTAPVVAMVLAWGGLIASPASAAIALKQAAAGNQSGSGAVSSLAVTVAGTTAGDTGVVVIVTINGTTVGSVTDNATGGSSTYSLITSKNNGTTRVVYLYSTAAGGLKGGATSVTVNSISPASATVAEFAEYSGVANLGNIATPTTGTSGTATISVTTQDDNNWVVGGFGLQGNSTFTAGANTTIEHQNINTVSPSGNRTSGAITVNTTPGTAGLVTLTVTLSSLPWEAVALELRSVATLPQWSYVTGAATLAPPGLDPNDVMVTGSNANTLIGVTASTGAVVTGFPFNATGPIQALSPVIPAAYSQTGVNIAYVSSQDGYVYAVNTSTGAQVWKSPSLATNTHLQGGPSVMLKKVTATTVCGVSTDVVFVGTHETSTSLNKVYALNGGNTTVTTGTAGGGNCVPNSTQVPPGGILWAFNGGVAPIRLVQQKTGAGGSSVTITLGSLPQANNLLILVGGDPSGLGTPTGGGVTAWSLAAKQNTNSDAEIWYGITNGSSAAVTITGTKAFGNLSEWSGMNQTQGSVKDVTATGTGTTATAKTTAGMTTINANDLIIFDVGANATPPCPCVTNWGTGPTPGTWTVMQEIVETTIANDQESWYSIVATAQLYNPSEAFTGAAGWWDAAMASFKAAGSTNPKMDIISSTPYVDYTNNVLWVTSRAAAGTTQPSVWKFNLSNGALASGTSTWNLNDIDSSPTPSSDGAFLYVGTNGGKLYAIKVSDGTTPGSPGYQDTHCGGTCTAAINGLPWPLSFSNVTSGTPDTIIYTQGTYVQSVNFSGTTFTANWSGGKQLTGTPTLSAPIDNGGGGYLFIGGSDSKVHQLDVATGTDKTSTNPTIPGAAGTVGNPAFDGTRNAIYVGSTNGSIYSYSAPW
jgi:hypothetical protein